VRNLLRLGTKLKTAIYVAISRKAYWRLARTLATQTGMIPLFSGNPDLSGVVWGGGEKPPATKLAGHTTISALFLKRQVQ